MATNEMQAQPLDGMEGNKDPFAISMLYPLFRATFWGLTGYFAAAWITAAVTGNVLVGALPATVGYVAGMIGWLLGSGV